MNNNVNKPLFDRRGKNGIYSVVVALILLTVLVVVNLIVGTIPANLTMIDTTASGQYKISGTTENFISGIDENVTIYYIVPAGYEDEVLSSYLERYVSLSPKLTLKPVDPLENPAFLNSYPEFEDISGEFTDSDYVSSYLLIETAARYRVLFTDELYTYSISELGASGLSFEEAVEIYSYYAQYGYYLSIAPDGYYFDSRITGAVEYVCAKYIPSVYVLSGHNEAAFTDTVATYFSDYGIDYKELNLALQGDSVPADCSCIIIHNPAADLTANEARKLAEYVAAGGNILLTTDKNADKFVNLMSLTAEFGLLAESGIVAEGDSSYHVPDLPEYIYPKLNLEHASLSRLYGYRISVLLASAQSIKVSEASGYTATELLTTSDKATVDGKNEGKKVLAAISEGNNGGGKLVWVASSSLTNDAHISKTTNGNAAVFMEMANALLGNYISALPEIESISMSTPVLTTSETDVNIWGAVLLFIAPGALLAAGIAYIVYRRRR